MSLEISLTTMELYVNEKEPSVEFFKRIEKQLPPTYEVDSTYHILKCEYIADLEYFWFYSCYGTPLPYNELVYNANKEEFEANPREKNQVEPRQQLFAIYSLRKKELFISNSKKKNLLQGIFSKFGGEENVVIRKIYADVDSFLQTLKGVSSIRMVTKRDLLCEDNDIFKASSNMFGLGEPEQMKMELQFGMVKPTDKFRYVFKQFSRDGRSKRLVCVGTDEDKLESVFNAGKIEDRITIYVQPNQDGMQEEASVKAAIIARLDE